ncbi:hypothetical protein AW19_4149 (plasmid) [Yersinia frederiksenii Y225]|nr:hypothetical protein AW19_4149 [Yersinia frederiksenii Y225]
MSEELKDAKSVLYPELVKILLGDVNEFHESLSLLPQHVKDAVKDGETELLKSLESVKQAIEQLPIDLDAGIEAKKRELAEEAEVLSITFEKGKGELQGIKDSALTSISQAIVSLSEQAAKLNQESANKITDATKKSLSEFNESVDLLVSRLKDSLSTSQNDALTEFKHTAIKSLSEMNTAYGVEYKKIQDLQQKTETTLDKFEKVIDTAFSNSGKKLRLSLLSMMGLNIVITVICFGAFYLLVK